jgi:hypothetical protein
MDYDNFRQMVLGANLIPMKKGQVENIHNMSATAPINSTAQIRVTMDKGYDESAVKDLLMMGETDSLKAPFNSAEFEKMFLRKLKEPF